MSTYAPRKCKERKRFGVLKFYLLILLALLVCQVIAQINYWREQAIQWREQAEKKPEVVEVPRVKEVIRWKEKKVYINRRGEDVTAIVEYSKKKFGSQAPIALAIFTAESGLYSKAVNYNSNGSVDSGIAQINSCHCHWVDCSRLFDWRYNIDVAYQLSGGGKNWYPWTVYKTGAYRKYLGLFE